MKLQKYARYLGIITLAVAFAAACSSSGISSTDISSMASDNEIAVQKTITNAKSALSKAEKDGYAWRDTGKFIKQAEQALAAGETAKATALATKALEQTEMARKQSIEQDRAVKERFDKS